ncbi:MAG: transposase [Schlesneria sp.]|jgi:hypothetical protein
MPRANRIDIANGVHHVTQRGLERMKIVRSDEDRSHWWRLFDRVAMRYHWRVFSVALLDNHFHVYLRTPEPNLSEGMRDLDGGYGSLFNQRHEREGPLYQGRFKSVLVESDVHAWEVSRYVHLNPVRAKLTSDPFQYRWSSYRFYLDSQYAPDWLDWRTVLAEFAGTEAAARIAYKRFVESGMSNPPDNPLSTRPKSENQAKSLAEGKDNDWLKPAQRVRISLEDVIIAVCQVFKTSAESVNARGRHNNGARDAAVFVTRELLPLKLEELTGVFGGVSKSSISEIVKRTLLREATDSAFRQQLEAVRELLR